MSKLKTLPSKVFDTKVTVCDTKVTACSVQHYIRYGITLAYRNSPFPSLR